MADRALLEGHLGAAASTPVLRWRRPSSAIVVIALMVVGCSAAVASPDSGAALAAFREQATEEQRPYFDDGVVTFEEYEEAVFATVTCLEGSGYVAEAQLAADGFYQYIVRVDDESDQSDMDRSVDDCRAQWSAQVELAFQSAAGPERDDIPAVEATIACLRDAGEPPLTGTSVQQLFDFIQTLPSDSPARGCAELLPDI